MNLIEEEREEHPIPGRAGRVFNRRDTVAPGEGGANSMVAPTERINDGEGRRRSGKPFTRKTYSTRRAYTPQL